MGDRRPRPALTHPVALVALGLLLVNDHVLKAAWPGWWTGKLSDVAALIVAPIAVAAVWQALDRRPGAPLTARAPFEAAIAVAFAVAFAAVKLEPHANAAYAVVVGALGWPIGVAGDLLAGRPIQPLGVAPTVLDVGDLIALPAVLVGWWLTVGAPAGRFRGVAIAPRAPVGAARMAVLATAWFALAATSQSIPTSSTKVADDTVTIAPGGAPIERHATVTVSPPTLATDGESLLASVRVQARPLWPTNQPPARFRLTIARTASADGEAPVVAIAPDRCNIGCTLDVTVAIDWPTAASGPPSSVAWELVATVDNVPSGYVSAPFVRIDPDGFAGGRGRSGTVPIGAAILIVIAALIVGGTVLRGPLRAAPRPGSALRLLIAGVLVVATAVLAILLVGSVLALPVAARGSPLANARIAVGIIALAAAAGLVVGLRWWIRGFGEVLTVVAIAIGVVALPTAGVLVAAAGGTFADRGNALGVALGAVLAVVALFANARRDPDRPIATDGQVVFLGLQGALMAAMLIGAGDANLAASGLGVGLLALALALWWEGSGWPLGLASLVILGSTGVAVFAGGSALFGPRWMANDQLVQATVVVGGLIGLAAAIGIIAQPPKPEAWRPTDAVRAALAIEPVDAGEPPSSAPEAGAR